MLLIPLNPRSDRAVYLQIADHITTLARNGQLRSGDRLPPSRSLADQLKVHRSTVVNAYQELKARGVIDAYQGGGSFIVQGLADPGLNGRPRPPAALAPPEELIKELWRLSRVEGVVSLALGLPADELMPIFDFDLARQRVLRRDGARALNYEEPQGYYGLRQAIASDLARHGVLADADDIVITWGAQEGVSLVTHALCPAGEAALTEVPAFFGTLFNLGHLGVHLYGFDLSNTGPDWRALGQKFDSPASRPRFVAVAPDHHNPTGIRWSMSERHRFLEYLAEQHTPVIEDATYRDLSFEGPLHPPLRALEPDVIYVGSFSKSLMPALRVGYVLAGGRLRDELLTLKIITSGSGEALGQRALADFLYTGRYEEHLARTLPVYRARRDAMLEAMQQYFPAEAQWSCPAGGFYVWVRLPEAVPAERVFQLSLDQGIVIAPAPAFYPAHQPIANAFRLTYARQPEQILTLAVKKLGEIIKSLLLREKRLAQAQETRSI